MFNANSLYVAFLLHIFISANPGSLQAQTGHTAGRVASADGEPLAGVSVSIRGDSLEILTDENGFFSITVPEAESVLIFRAEGYEPQAYLSGNQTQVYITLLEVEFHAERIPLGYTSRLDDWLPGAVSVIEPGKLNAMAADNLTMLMQGSAAGVHVIGTGLPGAMARIRIRGSSSFRYCEPLYVVDGVPTSDIGFLDPSDIASLSVLKDAGAAAVFGSRASNGVVVIKTQQGSKNLQVNVSFSGGVQYPGKGPFSDLLSASEHASLQWLVYENDGYSEFHPNYGPSSEPRPTLPAWAANTDWYDEITNRAGIQQQHASFSGGNKSGNFIFSMGHFKQSGILKHTSAERFNVRFNSGWTMLNGRLKLGENLAVMRHNYHLVSNLEEGSPFQMGPYRSMAIIPAFISTPVEGLSHQFEPGEFGGNGMAPRLGNSTNVLSELIRNKDDIHFRNRAMGCGYAELSFSRGLLLKSLIGGTLENGYWVDYSHSTYENASNQMESVLTEAADFMQGFVWTNILSYSREFQIHQLDAIAGYEILQTGKGRNLYAQRSGYFSDDMDFRTLTNGATITASSSYSLTPQRTTGLFLQAAYRLLRRYDLHLSVRRDGSSLFGSGNRYQWYPAGSISWRAKGEPFVESLKWLSDLRFSVSYGQTGNQLALSPGDAHYVFQRNVISSYYDLNGTGNSSLPGYYPVQMANPALKGETQTHLNLGVNTGFFDQMLLFGIAFYKKNTHNLVMLVDLPQTLGGSAYTAVNSGEIANRGFEIELSFNRKWKDLSLAVAGMLSSNRNEIESLADGMDCFSWDQSRIGPLTRNQSGHSLSSFYGYRVTGLFQTEEEIQSSPGQSGAGPGFFKFANTNTSTESGEQVIDPNDQVFIGNPNPRYIAGLDISIQYKRFDLNAFFYGSRGNDIFNWNKWWTDFWPSYQGQKSKALLNESWTPGRTDADVPKASNISNFSTNTVPNSYYIEDGSYLRLRNLQLGYSIAEKVLTKVNINTLRLYLQAVNLITITRYSGLDPEIGGIDAAYGIDRGNYPQVRQMLMGLQITLK